MAKHRPPRPLRADIQADRAAPGCVLGQDLSTPEGEAAARHALYRRLRDRARWIDACDTLARRFLGRPADDPRDVPDDAFLKASHSLIWAGAEPPDWSDPEWFPPEVHAFLAQEDRAPEQRRGRSPRRRPRPADQKFASPLAAHPRGS